MSTNGCVAIGTPDSWRGRYNHWDSYPEGLGKDVWAQVARGSIEDLAVFSESLNKDDEVEMSSNESHPCWISWIYVVDVQSRLFHVLTPSTHGTAEDGYAGHHRLVFTASLEGPEPDWKELAKL